MNLFFQFLLRVCQRLEHFVFLIRVHSFLNSLQGFNRKHFLIFDNFACMDVVTWGWGQIFPY